MKEVISPRDTTPKLQRSESSQEQPRRRVRREQSSWMMLDALSDRLLMDDVRVEQVGPEYWLG